jgi:dUTP pyrophosphatase
MSGLLFQVKKLTPQARVPVKGSSGAAGFDLFYTRNDALVIPARGSALIPTDISISIPCDTYARIAPRSGLALKNKLDVGAGVVDCDYRGPIGVVMFNHSTVDYTVNNGDRIAQLILEKIDCHSVPVEVDNFGEETTRGSGGFGSTGL